MKLISMVCPHCGAQLQIEDGRKQVFCSHCGSKLLIDDEVIHHQFDDAEEAGYKFEKGRLKAQAEARMQQQSQTYSYVPPEPEKPKKRRTWLWVLGWLLIFPVPLTILMLRKKDMNPKLKYGIIVASWIVYLALGAGGGKKTGTAGEQTSASSVTVETAEPKNLDTLLETDAESKAEESVAESTEQAASETTSDSRPQRNGFNHCNTIVQGLYEFQVPDYFVQTKDVPFYRGYAETGEKTAFLDIRSDLDEKDPVGVEWFDSEEEREKSAKAGLLAMESQGNAKDGQIISDGIYKTENYTGHLFEYKITFEELESSGKYLMFPSEDNNHWVSVSLFCTDNTEYRYDDDFKRIIDSIRKVESAETQAETTAATEPETETTEPETTIATEPATEALQYMSIEEYANFIVSELEAVDYTKIEYSDNIIIIYVARRGLENTALQAMADKETKKQWDKSMKEIAKMSGIYTDQANDFCGKPVKVSVTVVSDKDHKTVLYTAIEGRKFADITD